LVGHDRTPVTSGEQAERELHAGLAGADDGEAFHESHSFVGRTDVYAAAAQVSMKRSASTGSAKHGKNGRGSSNPLTMALASGGIAPALPSRLSTCGGGGVSSMWVH